jgi:hypothetical protein
MSHLPGESGDYIENGTRIGGFTPAVQNCQYRTVHGDARHAPFCSAINPLVKQPLLGLSKAIDWMAIAHEAKPVLKFYNTLRTVTAVAARFARCEWDSIIKQVVDRGPWHFLKWKLTRVFLSPH